MFLCPSASNVTKVTQENPSGNWPEEWRHQAAPTSYLVSTSWMYAAHQQWPGNSSLDSPAGGPLQTRLPNGELITSIGMFGPNNAAAIRDITDGTSNCLMVGERVFFSSYYFPYTVPAWGQGGTNGLAGMVQGEDWWYPNYPSPTFIGADVGGYHCYFKLNSSRGEACYGDTTAKDFMSGCFSSEHGGKVVHFAFADGSVRALSKNIDWSTYIKLGNISDGTVTGEF